MKKIITALSLFAVAMAGTAQQDYQFTHFMFDKLSFNPGYAGITNSFCGTVIGRQQWAGFDGSPTTALLNVHAPVKMLRGGLGLTYLNDQLGFEKNNIARLAYSYHLGGIGPGTLGIGVSGGIVQKSINATWVTPDGTPASADPTINTGGVAGNSSNISELVSDFNFGLYYHAQDMYFGLSATHIGQAEMINLNIQNVQHYWLTAGYNHIFSPKVKLRTNLLAKTDVASTQIDINANVLYNNMLWGGLTYRLGDAIAPMLGYQKVFDKNDNNATLRIGYAYDITTSQIKNYSSGSHEIFINYCFSLVKPPVLQKSKNPRFL